MFLNKRKAFFFLRLTNGEEEFIIDFKDVMYVTMNYAQAYYTAKNESPKKISEINISDEIRVIMGAADEACNP